MHNRIGRVDIFEQSVDPAQAVLRLEVTPERMTPATELRGRLLGPRCHYADTVEVALPVRQQSATSDASILVGRAVLPEASFWEPESPFLYQALLELWQDSLCCDRIAVAHGLCLVQLGRRGLLVNGRPLFLRGREVDHCTEAAAMKMRQEGINLWVVPANEARTGMWELADRLGFFVLGRVASEDCHQLVDQLGRHASCLGWLHAEAVPPHGRRGLLGLWTFGPPDSLREAQFLACPEEKLAACAKRNAGHRIRFRTDPKAGQPKNHRLG